jgi:hypothetical protein
MIEKYVNDRKARCYGAAGLKLQSPQSNSRSRVTVPRHIFGRGRTCSASNSDEVEVNTS